MNNALLSQIQSGKGLKKVAAHEKNDRSEVKGTGAVVGSSNNNSRGKRTLARGNRILLQFIYRCEPGSTDATRRREKARRTGSWWAADARTGWHPRSIKCAIWWLKYTCQTYEVRSHSKISSYTFLVATKRNQHLLQISKSQMAFLHHQHTARIQVQLK
jgi:hypothetical protein